ncbi:hypothetical protein RI578_39285 [Streptomyces sp. BB1-1-1]|uniref:hypothetical protein n=1 Tax=Streptomyces sp. BB1-1-1 TaxID=3074430 RepID=UPI0028778906|nr:hypothetical protein [Streptomyces sp. BB1-1-1]WND39954.1 hypothetical protein RI578_39285 [Streptomyces sp. BB1-1-1]
MTDGPSLTEQAPRADRAGVSRAPIYAVELADAVGVGMYLASSVLFLSRAVDLSNHEVGLILGVSGVASMAGAMPIARADTEWLLLVADAYAHRALERVADDGRPDPVGV